jgi:hypothetical protein
MRRHGEMLMGGDESTMHQSMTLIQRGGRSLQLSHTSFAPQRRFESAVLCTRKQGPNVPSRRARTHERRDAVTARKRFV